MFPRTISVEQYSRKKTLQLNLIGGNSWLGVLIKDSGPTKISEINKWRGERLLTLQIIVRFTCHNLLTLYY